MQSPQFEKFQETEQVIRPDEEYFIPSFNPQKTTHVGVRNGHIAFFYSKSDIAEYRSKNRGWRYWLIPNDAKAVVFSNFRQTAGGYNYGQPAWCF